MFLEGKLKIKLSGRRNPTFVIKEAITEASRCSLGMSMVPRLS
jgi:hypothetical protein